MKFLGFFQKVILASLLALISACDVSSSGKKVETSGNSEFTRKKGFFLHVKAELEVIKTGEALNFDYVISCYNTEVPGSFVGALKPKLMFKATSTGEAVAIFPPEHHCLRGVRKPTISNKHLEQPRDQMVIPQVTWYPNVNDLSYGLHYMSDSAYHNPHTQLKFKSYSFVKTNKDHFIQSMRRLEEEYKQIGAIPGPFGCQDESISSYDEYACAHLLNLYRNDGRRIVIFDEYVHNRHVRVYDVPRKLISAIRRLPHGKGRYYCGGGKIDDGDPNSYVPRIDKIWRGSTFTDEEKEVFESFFERYRHLTRKQFLTWDVVENGSSDVKFQGEPVTELFPVIGYGVSNYFDFSNVSKESFERYTDILDYYVKAEQPEPYFPVVNILYEPRWKGFTIGYSRAITEHMPEVAIDFDPYFRSGAFKGNKGVGHFINGDLVCVSYSVGKIRGIYDLEKGLFFIIKY